MLLIRKRGLRNNKPAIFLEKRSRILEKNTEGRDSSSDNTVEGRGVLARVILNTSVYGIGIFQVKSINERGDSANLLADRIEHDDISV